MVYGKEREKKISRRYKSSEQTRTIGNTTNYLDFRTVGPNNRLPSGKGPIRSNSSQSCDWLKQYVAVARHSGRKFKFFPKTFLFFFFFLLLLLLLCRVEKKKTNKIVRRRKKDKETGVKKRRDRRLATIRKRIYQVSSQNGRLCPIFRTFHRTSLFGTRLIM